MDFVKISNPTENKVRIIHCKNCDCDDTEKSSLKEDLAKATGG